MDEVAKAKKSAAEAGDLHTRVFPVNYSDLSKLKDAIDKAKVVSSRGSITLDERGSSLIINDLDSNLEQIGALITELDQESMQARQVVIEAKIVEVNSDFTKELGVQWGMLWDRRLPENSFVVSKAGNTDSKDDETGEVTLDNNLLNVNLPAAHGLGTGGAIGISYLSRRAGLVLNLQLSAMEQLKKGKVLSSPSVMTMNNQEAKITQGKTIYLGIATSDKIDYKAIDALLSLTVKPRIAPGGAIFMDLDITKDEPGTVTTGGVDILKNTVKTSVLVNNSETVVIGGIFKQKETYQDDSIPGLSKIPILGYLFKHNAKVTNNTEVMIFITPKIVEFSSMK
jgi:type IV pilus assembly protein PilQ